ncbi:hypothetical protein ABS771_08465 [Methylobacterium brachiatum]|uniref:Phage tail tape measure protein n=1 Tax=Methylobacterium brachiatum TaxID=269660 RepID=A0ABV1QVK7_9HYPH
MSDKVDIKVNLDVEVNEIEQARALRREFELMDREISKLGRDLKAFGNPMATIGRMRGKIGADAVKAGREALNLQGNVFTNLRKEEAFKRRMAAQRASEEAEAVRAAKQGQRATEQALKRQLASSNALSRQRARAEAEAEGEIRSEIASTARMRDREVKKAISDAKAVKRAQEQATARAARGAGQIRSGVERVAGTAAATTAVAGYGVQRAVSRGISSRTDADTAETQLKIFGDIDDGKGGKRAITAADIRKLRRGPEGLDNLAVRTGSTVPGALNAYTEAAKAGLIDPMGQTKNILTASSGLELDPTKTTKVLGTLARNMGKEATPDRMYKTLNALAVGAREDPTQSDEIVEGLNRAQAVLAMTKGLTPEDLVALVSGGQSVGIQPGKAGTLLPALATDILAGNNKFLDPKKRKEHNWAAKKLGFASGRDMSKQFAGENGKATLYKIFESLKSMAPELRSQVANALSGGQWGDEDLQIVNGLEGMKSTDAAIQDPKNSNFLREANAKKMNSWQGQWNQSQAIFSLFWESFGQGFDDILRSINSFFLELHSKFDYDAVTGAVNDALDGLKKGLGFDTWRQALESLVPSNAKDLGKQIGAFACGFSSAIKDISGVIKSVATIFTGSNASAESIGRLAGSFVSLGVAAVALAPVMGVLGGVASLVLGIVGIARAAASVLGMGAAAAGAGGGAVAGALAGVAKLMAGGFIVGLAGAIGSMRGEISTLVLDAVRPMVAAIWQGLKDALSWEGLKSGGKALLNEVIPAPLQRWLEGGDTARPNEGGTGWVDPPTRDETTPRKLTEAIQQNTDALLKKSKAEADKAKDADGKKAISYEDWKAQFDGLKGGSYGRALEAQKDKSGGPVWAPSVGDAVQRGLRGEVGTSGGGGSTGGPLGTGMGRRGIIGGDTGSPGQRIGGSRAWRNFNPGNLKDSPFTRRMGSTGRDAGGFAVFPDDATGRKAQEALLFNSDSYKNLSIRDAIARYAPGSDGNDPASYAGQMARAAGVGVDTKLSDLTPDQRSKLLDAQRDKEGWRAGTVAGGGDGSIAGAPGTTDGRSVPRLTGNLSMDGQTYQYGSGGHRGSNSIPAGVYPLTPGAIGPWGRQHGALGINNNRIWDAQLGRFRDGIELHSASSAKMLSAGCLAINREQWSEFRSRALDFYRRNGNRAFLKVDSKGNASITAERPDDPVARVAEQDKKTKDLGAGLNKPSAALGDLDVAPTKGDGLGTKAPLGTTTPLKQAPIGSSGGGGNGGSGGIVNNVTVNAANHSPNEMANAVQRSLQDSMNRRTHDFDGFA